jgi:hypothetical protein
MGASASAIGELPEEIDFTTFQTLVAGISPDVFNQYCTKDGKMSRATLLQLANKADVFLSHDWGVDELGRDNHERVKKIKLMLEKRDIICWLDEDQMTGDIQDKMAKGIDNSNCIIAFCTRRYMEKVGGDNEVDNCKLEFGYSVRRKGVDKMIPVVLDPSMRNTREWTGKLGFNLGGLLYVDCSSDEKLEESVDSLCREIKKRTRTLKGYVEAPANLAPAVAVAPPGPPSAAEESSSFYMTHISMGGDVYFASSRSGDFTGSDVVIRRITDCWASSISLCRLKNTLCMTYVGVGNKVFYSTCSSDVLSAGTEVPGWWATNVAMTTFRNRIVVMHIGRNGNVYVSSFSNPQEFSGEVTCISGWWATSISMVTFQDKLYVVHVGTGGGVYVAVSSDGSDFSHLRQIPGWAARVVSMAVCNDMIHVVHANGAGEVYMASAVDEMFEKSLYHVSSWWASHVSLGTHNNKLYLCHTGRNGGIYVAESVDGKFEPNSVRKVSNWVGSAVNYG